MKQLKLSWALALLMAAFGLTQHVRADSVTNNFTSGADYVANGIIGETNWDGVYLGNGDLPNSSGGNGVAQTLTANSTLTSGILTLQTTGTGWGGNNDNGFYLWKLVSGDFDVSIENVPAWQSQGNNFAGLLIRAWNTNQSGARISFSSTNSSENFLQLWRDQQFAGTGSGGSQIRQATNGTDIQYNTAGPGDPNDTNSARFFRITRTGDTFTFYWKTNQTDPWTVISNAATGAGYNSTNGTIMRPDWDGQPVQVGVAQAIFARPTTPVFDFFTDFELSGPNVTAPPAMPAAPTGLTTSSPNTNGSLTFSWTKNGGTGSVLIIRKIAPSGGLLVVNPIQGLTYNADTNFPDTNTLIAGSTHVVYVGSASSATVTGLGGSNNIYVAEVLSYDNSSGTNIYNTASPATLGFLGSGLPASISFNVNPANIPLNGVGHAIVVATFSTGEQVDVSTDPSVTVSSSDPTTISVLSDNSLDGLKLGSATITGSYAGFSATALVPVTPYRFTDNFSTSQDYLNAGLPGSTWDGIFDRPGDVVGNAGGDGAVSTTDVDANVSSNDVLTVIAGGGDWAGTSDDGFYLFKNITGDFQAQVHVTFIPRIVSTNANNGDGAVGFMFGGLMARATNTPAENWVYWSEFDQFADSTEARFAQNGVDTEHAIFDGLTKTNYWLLMQRVNSTNFYFYRKVNVTDPWEPHPEIQITQPNMTNASIEAGIFQATYSSTSGTMQFDSFSLDNNSLFASPPTNPPPAATNFSMVLNPDITMTLRWTVPGTNSDGSAFRSVVVMRAGAPVSAQPYLAFALGGDVQGSPEPFGVADDNMGDGNYVVFRTTSGDTNLNPSVTVTGLSPGVQYYAAVYTFVGLGAQRTFNTATSATANSPGATLIDGVLLGLQATVPGGGIPLGGIGLPLVNGIFSGGALVPITPATKITSDNTNVVVAVSNVLSGMAMGSTTIHVVYQSFTNVVSVSVNHNFGLTDNFSTAHDYVANGVANTIWDGVFLGAAAGFPDQDGGNDGVVSVCDASITTNDTLTVTHTLTDWAGGGDDGFLLFKNVTGDFQAMVHMTSLQTLNYQFAGIMARGYSTNGEPLVVGTNAPSENWVYWGEFEQFNDSTESRFAFNGGDNERSDLDGATNNFYMLLARQNGTNFFFCRKVNLTDPWTPQLPSQVITQPNLSSDVSMEVGLFAAMYTANVGTVQYDSFGLDVIAPTLTLSPAGGGNAQVSWQVGGFTLQSTPTLNPANWQPVVQPTIFTNGVFSVQVPDNTTNQFFRLKK